ncbi:MAG: hypothetical protein IH595_10830 [Bacteroidales bacterium]|nr:hypothetical protein [Bacteroidales bacterium]
MTVKYKALVIEMQDVLTVRKCISYDTTAKCKGNFDCSSPECARTITFSEGEAFLKNKGIKKHRKRVEILKTLRDLGFIEIRRCSGRQFFEKKYFTENGEWIIVFLD